MVTRRPARSLGPDALLLHREWIERVAHALVLGDADADDVGQQVWADVLARPPAREPVHVRSWLRSVLRFKTIDAGRAARTRARHEEAAARPERVDADPADVIARAETLDRVAHAVLELDEPYRTTVLLRWFEDLPPHEIAQRQGVPVETVRTRLKRAVARLRRRLDAENDGDRGAWCLVLLPLLRRPSAAAAASGSAASTAAGVVIMGLKTKVAVAAAVLLVLAGSALVWHASRGEPVQTSEGDAESAVPWAQRTRPLRARSARIESGDGPITTVHAVDVETGDAVPSARFSLVSDAAEEPLTAMAGAATLRNPASSSAREVRVVAPGYAAQRWPVVGAGADLIVPLRRLGTLDVRVVTGRVFEPVAGAEVAISRRSQEPGALRNVDPGLDARGGATLTSSDGLARFDGIERTGLLRVSVRAPHSAPETFSVRAAQERVTLTLGNVVGASVEVTDERGAPVPGAGVWSYGPSGREECRTKTDDSGTCIVSNGGPAVCDGRFRLVVIAPDGSAVARLGNLLPGDNPIRIALPTAERAGVTLVRNGRPVSGADVRFAAVLPFAAPAGAHDLRAATDAAGRASITVISGAAYAVCPSVDRFRGPSRVFDAAALAGFPEIEAVGGHELRITVVDDAGAPVPGAVVRAAMEEPELAGLEASGRWQRSRDLPTLGETDSSGCLEAEIADGARVALRAACSAADSEWLFVDRSEMDVVLKVVRKAAVEVMVTDAAGAALAGVEVDLIVGSTDELGRPTNEVTARTADRGGRVSFVVSRAYESSLSAVVGGVASRPERIDDAALRSGHLTLVVPRIRQVRTRVVDESRQPVQSVMVLASSEQLDWTVNGVPTDAQGEAFVAVPVAGNPGSGAKPTTTFSVIGSHVAYVTVPTADIGDAIEVVARALTTRELKFTVAPVAGLPDGGSLLCFTQQPGGAGRVFRSVVVVGTSTSVDVEAGSPVELVFAAEDRVPAVVGVEADVEAALVIDLPAWREISITNGGSSVAAVLLQEVKPGHELWVSPPILPGRMVRVFVRSDAQYGVRRSVDSPARWSGRALRDATQVVVSDAGVDVR